MLTGKGTVPEVVYSQRLVDLARAHSQLVFALLVARAEYEFLYSEYQEIAAENEGNTDFLPDNKRRTELSLNAIASAAMIARREFFSLLAAESERYGGVAFDGDNVVVPGWAKLLFIQCCENGGAPIKTQIDQLIQSGFRVVFWKNGWNSRESTFQTWLFPKELSPSVVDVWWHLACGYDAPSFLNPVSDSAWEVIHAEE